MTVMSEGLLLNSKYIKMGREEGGFQALITQLPLVIICHELINWSEMLVQYFMSSQVGKKVTHVKPTNSYELVIVHTTAAPALYIVGQ